MIPVQISALNNCKTYPDYLFNTFRKWNCVYESYSLFRTIEEFTVVTNKQNNVWFIEASGQLMNWLDALDKKYLNGTHLPQRIWLTVNSQDLISIKNQTEFVNRVLSFKALVTFRVELNMFGKLGINLDTNLWKLHTNQITNLLENPELSKVCFWTYEINDFSGPWADDFFMKVSSTLRNEILFYPSADFLQEKNEIGTAKFHAMMFFASQSRKPGMKLAQRLNNKRWAERMQKNTAVSTIDVPVVEMLIKSYYPDRNEWFYSTRSLFYGKLSQVINRRNNASPKVTKFNPAIVYDPTKWKKVLITGWYGTETNGDKAILGEVIHFIREQSSNCKIILTTIYLPVSMQTNLELDELKDVELISIYKKNFDNEVNSCDAVIMGGGPMMETSEMDNVLKIFETANRYRKARIIFGCGVGPFHGPKYENLTKRVIELCTAGFFRDKESWEYAKRMIPENNLKYACDPAVGFIHRWRQNNLDRIGKSNAEVMVSLLRSNTGEFTQGMNSEDLEKKNHHSANVIAKLLSPFLLKTGMQLKLLHMNAPWVGGDDRLYNRMVEEKLPESVENINIREYYNLDQHLLEMSSSQMTIAMRYHGHIFSMALGLPFVSIDYTGKKGKVSSLIERIGYSKYSMNWNNLEGENSLEMLYEVYNNKEHLSKHLLGETEKLVALLQTTYKEVFLTNH